MKKQLYEIEILNWKKHNAKQKIGHTHIMLSKNFLDDPKIKSLSNGAKLLFLGLLLRRADVDTTLLLCSHDDLVMLAGGRGHVVSMLLNQLQSFQLVRWQKSALTLHHRTSQDVTVPDVTDPAGPQQKNSNQEKLNEPKKEVQIQNPEKVQKLKLIENQIFKIIGDTGFSRYTKQLDERFQTFEEFQRMLEEIVDSATKEGKFKSIISQRKYLRVALMKEIGVMRESAASK